MDNQVVFMVIAGLLFLALIFMTLRGSKSRKLKITVADGTEYVVTRKYSDAWEDLKEMKCYHQGEQKIWVALHWILKIEEIKK